MSLLVKPTPMLCGRDADAFERRMAEQASEPCPTMQLPSLDAAKKAIFGAKRPLQK